MWTIGSSLIGASRYEDAMLSGDVDELYEYRDDCDAADVLRVGGESDGVREAALLTLEMEEDAWC